MMSFNNKTIIFTVLLIVTLAYGYGEENLDGHPNWRERSTFLIVNAIRMAPQEYLKKYTFFSYITMMTKEVYPPVAPLYYEHRLGLASKYHSDDMVQNGCFQHNSCNGENTFDRISNFYQCSSMAAENIATGFESPIVINNLWICDDSSASMDARPDCRYDGSGDPHRKNIMDPNFRVMGVGAAEVRLDAEYIWTQDFGGEYCNTTISNMAHIHSGSHFFFKSPKNITFMATWYHDVAPYTAFVVINGTKFPLELDMGTKAQGVYKTILPTFTKDCREYYFLFTTFNESASMFEIFRYPDFGYLLTYGEGKCNKSFEWKSTLPIPTLPPTPTATLPSTLPPISTPDFSHHEFSHHESYSYHESYESTTTTSTPTEPSNSPITTETPSTPNTETPTTKPTSKPTNKPTQTPTRVPTSSSSSPSSFKPNNGYIGCYIDRIAHDLSGAATKNAQMTNQKCNSYCSSLLFEFSGTEGGDYCYCGDEYGAYGPLDKENCNSPCKGNTSEACGGFGALSISKADYQGCYQFSEMMSHFEKSAKSDNITNNGCRSYCKENGYLYSGIARDNICLCGNQDVSDIKSMERSKCTNACTGDKNQYCGGDDTVSVYYNGDYTPQAEVPTFEEDSSILKSSASSSILNTNFYILCSLFFTILLL
ncbi:hypothetical protein CYY_004724 [Polysphondylium violaceum]|uniref:WSC domain-containing protein n=1 Tax=Polysphondylium violaceum TaxID=133409 RepID=A0A8J4V7H9_9MYCE|nr:hypothetical protein CYY_004724 [Polysphondylium violaceum]